jgi:hypothetical protein
MKKFQIISISLIAVFVMGSSYKILFSILPDITTLSQALILAFLVGFISFCALVLCYLLKSLIVETFKK